MSELRKGLLLGVGNPLLDISLSGVPELLTKYNLSENNAILADDSHMKLYSDLVENYSPEYIAGGSVQNTLRVLQWVTGVPGVSAFFGCVGKDKFADILETKLRQEGVNVQYQVTEKKSTGVCAVLVNGNNRSLCTNLAAANCFTIDHIREPSSAEVIRNAEYFYISGYFLTVSEETATEIAKEALQHSKTFAMNLSAPFICGLFRDRLLRLLPYISLLFGNEQEAETLAEHENFGTKDRKEIAVKIANYPLRNEERGRIFILTQGENAIIVAKYGSQEVREFKVDPIPDSEIIDTNGAGDAFVGGFLAQFIQKKSLDFCIQCGIWAAKQIIRNLGCSFTRCASQFQSS